MGKPFKKELDKILEIYNWATEQSQNNLYHFLKESEKPVLVVGSGGSLSACYFLVSLLQNKGIIAKPLTPLEIYYSKYIINNCNIVFLSASGKNTDIIFAFKLAMQHEPNCIISICMKKDSPLASLARKFSSTKVIEYNIPTGNDGFLATNSLVAFFSIFFYDIENKEDKIPLLFEPSLMLELDKFFKTITKDYTFHVLYGGWGQSVAIDIESKFTEAALGNVLLSDYRNFGHGRHHWFAKKKHTAIIALVSPLEEMIARKTLSTLPSDIPHLILKTNYDSPFASIDLLVKSFQLVNKMGEIQGIDPGRPGVPMFGSKLYHLKYSSFYTLKKSKVPQNIINAILRKTKVKNFFDLNKDELNYWLSAYKKFINRLTNSKFCSIVFDYDGTLCSINNRYNKLSDEIIAELVRFLSKGMILGIVTGRGKSAREKLQSGIPQEYWENIIIGYYNGADISTLDDNKSPNKRLPIEKSIAEIHKVLDSHSYPYKPDFELRPNQLTIENKNHFEWKRLKPILLHIIMKSRITNIQILESSHSLDIISKPKTSKLNILPVIQNRADALGLIGDCLCIGDKGAWPGNDYELLSTPYSLSVDETSPDAETCWNISDIGVRNEQATLAYLNKLKVIDKSIIFIT